MKIFIYRLEHIIYNNFGCGGDKIGNLLENICNDLAGFLKR